MPYLLAALGGGVGALARWGVAEALPGAPGGRPWATLTVNLLGCLLIGALLAVLSVRALGGSWARPLLGVGVLGGFTTYSAFALDVVHLVEAGRAVMAAGYLVASVAGGLLAVVAGARAVLAWLGGPGP